jgi:hypothetical protein
MHVPLFIPIDMLMGLLYFAAFLTGFIVFVIVTTWDQIPVGTKSLLFGVHAFWWHPIPVWIAWRKLYKEWPDWRTVVCIWIHDLGYWGAETMDGADGVNHPEFGAELAHFLFGEDYYKLVLYHSRTIAQVEHELPSLLCWPDKYALQFDPLWFVTLRGKLSGETEEYQRDLTRQKIIRPLTSDYEMWRALRIRNCAQAQKASEHVHC